MRCHTFERMGLGVEDEQLHKKAENTSQFRRTLRSLVRPFQRGKRKRLQKPPKHDGLGGAEVQIGFADKPYNKEG